MPAYDYYCQLYKASDVATGVIDDFQANYQEQWECYAKAIPDKVVVMEFTAQGWTAADFDTQRGDVTNAVARSLGVTPSQVELSLTPFGRRLLVQTEEDLNIYARIKASNEEAQAIQEKTQDLSTLSEEISSEIEGASFEVTKTDTQSIREESSLLQGQSTTSEPRNQEEESKDVSFGTLIGAASACLLVGLVLGGVGYVYCLQKSDAAAVVDPEMGAQKRRVPELEKKVSLQKIDHGLYAPEGSTKTAN